MAVDSPARSAEDLRDMTRQWLHDHLPSGWMEAVDSGDAAAVTALRNGLDYSGWCVEFGEAGYARVTSHFNIDTNVVAFESIYAGLGSTYDRRSGRSRSAGLRAARL